MSDIKTKILPPISDLDIEKLNINITGYGTNESNEYDDNNYCVVKIKYGGVDTEIHYSKMMLYQVFRNAHLNSSELNNEVEALL